MQHEAQLQLPPQRVCIIGTKDAHCLEQLIIQIAPLSTIVHATSFNSMLSSEFDIIFLRKELIALACIHSLPTNVVVSVDRNTAAFENISVITRPYKYKSVRNILLSIEPTMNKVEICRREQAIVHNCSVLIVDDNTINQKVLSLMLAKLHVQADIANNGKEAIELAQKTHYNAIFMDLMVCVVLFQ